MSPEGVKEGVTLEGTLKWRVWERRTTNEGIRKEEEGRIGEHEGEMRKRGKYDRMEGREEGSKNFGEGGTDM